MDDHSAFVARLEMGMAACGYNQTSLADAVGTSQSYIGQIKRGEQAGNGIMPKIAEKLQCSEQWLRSATGQLPDWYALHAAGLTPAQIRQEMLSKMKHPSDASVLDDKRPSLAYVGQVTAGGGYVTESQDPDDWKPVMLRTGWKLVRIEGDSGLPIVFPGQSVIVDLDQKRTPAMHNRIVVVQTRDGRAYCKRWCVAGDGHIVLASLNSGADSVVIHEDDIASVAVVVGTLYTDSVAR